MSEALNSREIEDVLLSIRRLVSDDLRPAPGAAVTQAASGGDIHADPDKLLLTPALRVVSADLLPRDETEHSIDTVVAAVSAAVDQQVDEWESETGDTAPLAAEPMADAAPMAEDVTEADWDDQKIDAYYEPVAFRPAMDGAVDEGAAPQHDQSEDETLVGAPEADLPGWAQTQGAEEAEDATVEPWSNQTVEPDRAWADEAEAAVLQELSAASAVAQADPEDFNLTQGETADSPIDEAILREIVRDVLREELQGRLGERITRNIRKLVRAEIARVMATDDLMEDRLFK